MHRARLTTVMMGGRRVAPSPALAEARTRCARQLAALPEDVRRLKQPGRYPVRYGGRLVAVQNRLETETAAVEIAPYLPERVPGGADVH